MNRNLVILFALSGLFFLGNETAWAQKKKAKPEEQTPVKVEKKVAAPVEPVSSVSPYKQWRSELSDTYITNLQNQFNPFDIKPAAEDTIPKGDLGFRIQLISTRNRTTADSLFTRFQQWADSAALDYKLYSYFEFRSPDYRIHIGDFYRIQDANTLAARLLNDFNRAWVVHSRIIQDRSPFYQRLARSAEAEKKSN